MPGSIDNYPTMLLQHTSKLLREASPQIHTKPQRSILFLANSTGAPQDATLGLMGPRSNKSCSCAFISLRSTGAIQKGAFEIGMVPRTTSITTQFPYPCGIIVSSGETTSGNSRTNRDILESRCCRRHLLHCRCILCAPTVSTNQPPLVCL